MKYVNELYESKKAELLSKEQQIQVLKEEVGKMSKIVAQQIPFQEISAEAKTNYENLTSLGFSYTIRTDFDKLDTIPVFNVTWKKGLSAEKIKADSQKLTEWLRLRLKDARIQVKKEES